MLKPSHLASLWLLRTVIEFVSQVDIHFELLNYIDHRTATSFD
jgi:hypothetical protein